MSKVEKLVVICTVVGLIVAASGTAQANWEETFDGNTFDLTTWLFRAYPELTGTFSATIRTALMTTTISLWMRPVRPPSAARNSA